MDPFRSPRTYRLKVGLAVGAVVAASTIPMLALPSAQAAPLGPSTGTTRTITLAGTSTYHATAAGNGAYARGTEIAQTAGPDAGARVAGASATSSPGNRSDARSVGMSGGAGTPALNSAVTRTGPVLLKSFQGLNHFDQRTANGGNQFSLEPPDQGLCVGNGHVVEPINDVIRVYSTSGVPQTGVEDLNTFLGYPPAVIRSIPQAGPSVTDPSCLFDPTTHQFFFTALTFGVDPASGDFTGQDQLDIAVTANPTGAWTLYHVDVTDDGTNGTPVHPGCPCIGDYPHIGVDANGFYVTTNEYSFAGHFNGAQVYAFSKRALAARSHTIFVTQYDTTGADHGNPGFTVWPAQSPVANQYATGNHGTEYFLSSTAAPEANGTGRSSRIVVWGLTNTVTVGTAHPSASLSSRGVGVHSYSIPPLSSQKPGPTPLRDCLNDAECATVIHGAPDPYAPEAISPLDSNDSRMQQVTYAGGLLYGALDTGVRVGGATKAGVAYFVLAPTVGRGGVSGSLKRQGTLGLAANNLIYPAIGITAAGKGIISFTLVGAGYYPSHAFVGFDATHGAGAIQVAGAGVGPEDGFSGYRVFDGGGPGVARPRWGDYGATAVSGNTIWAAAEYVAQSCTLAQFEADTFGTCGGTRTTLANWSTHISQIRP